MTGPSSNSSPLLLPALTSGFSSAVAVWVAWFVSHVPWVGMTGATSAGLALAVWVIVGAWSLRGVAVSRAVPAGTCGGVFAAALGLLVLGSKLTTTATNGLTPGAPLLAMGFLLVGAVVGSLAGAVAATVLRSSSPADWLARFAWACVAAAAPLLFIGGLVTSTNSGMAVPDWPTTYSANMFLYPLGNAPTDVFLEHSHRLFGTLLGIGSLLLMALTMAAPKSSEGNSAVRVPVRLKIWSAAIFLAICLQGGLGGIRVLFGSADAAKDNRFLAFAHGVIAQLIFAALVAIALHLGRAYRSALAEPTLPHAGRLRKVAAAAFHTTLLQLIFGALYRHVGGSHSLWTHAGFSVVVLILTALAGFYASALPRPAASESVPLVRTLSMGGRWQIALVALQFALGWAAFAVSGHDRNAANTMDALIRTAHQANGALLLAATTLVAVLSRRIAPKTR